MSIKRGLAFVSLVLFATALGAVAAIGQGLGPPGGTIYVHDVAYQTVATPRDLPNQGKFDAIYVLGNGLGSVAESAPGDMDYNGGRWEVRLVTFVTIQPMQFTNVEDLRNAEAQGQVNFSEVVRRFECPLIRK